MKLRLYRTGRGKSAETLMKELSSIPGVSVAQIAGSKDLRVEATDSKRSEILSLVFSSEGWGSQDIFK